MKFKSISRLYSCFVIVSRNNGLEIARSAGKWVDYASSIKGQLISKGKFGVFKSTKKPTMFFKNFYPSI